jgi:hypothetical protein
MNKVQSGAVLIIAGILMNIAGRFFPTPHDVIFAGCIAVWMIASVVIGIFGLFRLISGVVKKSPR